MEKFGREALVEAYRTYKGFEVELEDNPDDINLEEEKQRKTLLARTLYEIVDMESKWGNSASWGRRERSGYKVDAPTQLQRSFMGTHGLEEDFDFRQLVIRPQNISFNRFARFNLSYGDVRVCRFDASGKSQFLSDEHYVGYSETSLWQVVTSHEGRIPIDFESEEYKFVKDVTGLFFPKLVRVMEPKVSQV